jgi:hypothetical protein
MGYHNKCKVKIHVGKHKGKIVKAEKAKNMNMPLDAWDMDPEPIYVTNTEDEYQFTPREVEVVEK